MVADPLRRGLSVLFSGSLLARFHYLLHRIKRVPPPSVLFEVLFVSINGLAPLCDVGVCC